MTAVLAMLTLCTVAAVVTVLLFVVSFQTSIDILTTVVRNTKPPLSQLLICQAFPAVAQCSLNTDDNATMQVTLQGVVRAAGTGEFEGSGRMRQLAKPSREPRPCLPVVESSAPREALLPSLSLEHCCSGTCGHFC